MSSSVRTLFSVKLFQLLFLNQIQNRSQDNLASDTQNIVIEIKNKSKVF